MKIKFTKQTLKSLKVILILLIMLWMVLQMQHSAKDKGESAVKHFFHTLGVTQ